MFVLVLSRKVIDFNPTTVVSRPDRLSSAEIASIVQAAGLQGTHHLSSAVAEVLIRVSSCS